MTLARLSALALIHAVLMLGGCAARAARMEESRTEYLRGVSAGKIGCPSDEIEVADFQAGLRDSLLTWTAQCRGRTYHCSFSQNSASFQGDCAEDASAALEGEVVVVAPPAVAEGCTYDTQCKGHRICEDGRCVNPPAAPAPAEPAE